MALSHIVMHVGLCNAALRLKSQTELPLRVVVTDRINRDVIDQKFRAFRDNGNQATVDFDVPWGIYRVRLSMKAPRITCSGIAYFTVLADHDRTLSPSMQDGAPRNAVPALVMGTAPLAFSYVQPTVVAFDKSLACNAAVPNSLDAGIVTENDSDGYYAAVFPNNTLVAHAPPVIAVRLTDSHGGYHYIRVPAKFMRYVGMSSWPSSVELNVNEDLIDYVADKPEDTLLCPRMYQTITS
jgi:hypothetical protein